MDAIPLYIYFLIPLVALLYASVGHGGASAYLALMALANVTSNIAKPTALALNMIVSAISFIQFYKAKQMNWHLFFYLAIASIPLAYLGASIELSESLYKKILGAVLLLAGLRLILRQKEIENIQTPGIAVLLLVGAGVGFLSGLIGIGGGIILSPLLILFAWANIKTTATVSALFIFINSASGMIASQKNGFSFTHELQIMILLAVTGGLLGSWLGARRWHQQRLKQVLTIVLFIAACKLIVV